MGCTANGFSCLLITSSFNCCFLTGVSHPFPTSEKERHTRELNYSACVDVVVDAPLINVNLIVQQPQLCGSLFSGVSP